MKLGQIIIGRSASYTITHKLYRNAVWQAISSTGGKVIVKSDDLARTQNERDILLKYQSRTPAIRPLVEIIDKERESPPVLILKYLDQDLAQASINRKLSKKEVKFVAKRVLEALKVLHKDGIVHTDVKPANVLANHGNATNRFTNVQLCDFGTSVSQDSSSAKESKWVGTPLYKSPETLLEMPWTTAADIWSFGTMLIDLLHGGDYSVFYSGVPVKPEMIFLDVLTRQYHYFGPFPACYEQIRDPDLMVLAVMVARRASAGFECLPQDDLEPRDRDLVYRIMKFNPKERPTAEELLEDEWFDETVD